MTADDLVALRLQMDALNRRLCSVLQERAQLALRIGRHKRSRGLPIADPAREQAMLDAAIDGAGPGFDARALRAILGAVFSASRALLETQCR
jgi:chorismate mutase